MSGKGSTWERDVCKFLSVWLTGKEKPYQFWRAPMSGGLATISELNSGLSGDIRALTPEAEFLTSIYSIECKNGYPKTSFWQHLRGIKNFAIEQFWEQCVRDAFKANKKPMLIYRKKGNQPIVGITNEFKFFDLLYIQSITLTFNDKKALPRLVFYDMKEFFKIITPDIMKEEMGI